MNEQKVLKKFMTCNFHVSLSTIHANGCKSNKDKFQGCLESIFFSIFFNTTGRIHISRNLVGYLSFLSTFKKIKNHNMSINFDFF